MYNEFGSIKQRILQQVIAIAVIDGFLGASTVKDPSPFALGIESRQTESHRFLDIDVLTQFSSEPMTLFLNKDLTARIVTDDPPFPALVTVSPDGDPSPLGRGDLLGMPLFLLLRPDAIQMLAHNGF